MIQDAETAKLIAEKFKDSFRALDEAAAIVRETCSENETEGFLKTVGPVCGNIIFELMQPLYEEHPDLKPDGWDDGPASERS